MKFYIVDAFTNEKFGGNPAGVVMVGGGDFPPFDIMVKTAAELRYSETVFIKQIDDKSYELRYFTPTDEVDLCGHATIAAFSVIGEGANTDSVKREYTALTKSGKIGISINSDGVMMDMAEPELIEKINDEKEWNHMREILGLPPGETRENNGDKEAVSPAIVSTGLPDIIFPIASAEELNSINPDFDAMSKLSKEKEVVGVHAYALSKAGDKMQIDCRNFAPLFGIPEEAATGTANGALTYYLVSEGILDTGKMNEITQGQAMKRPSKIMTLAEKDSQGNIKIRVGGNGVILSQGELFI